MTDLRATGSVKARMVFPAIYQSSKGGHSEPRTAATRSKCEHVAWRQRWMEEDRQDLSVLRQHDGKVVVVQRYTFSSNTCHRPALQTLWRTDSISLWLVDFLSDRTTIHSILLETKTSVQICLFFLDHKYNFHFRAAINDFKLDIFLWNNNVLMLFSECSTKLTYKVNSSSWERIDICRIILRSTVHNRTILFGWLSTFFLSFAILFVVTFVVTVRAESV